MFAGSQRRGDRQFIVTRLLDFEVMDDRANEFTVDAQAGIAVRTVFLYNCIFEAMSLSRYARYGATQPRSESALLSRCGVRYRSPV